VDVVHIEGCVVYAQVVHPSHSLISHLLHSSFYQHTAQPPTSSASTCRLLVSSFSPLALLLRLLLLFSLSTATYYE
jgi:hypothetical protein